MDEPVITLSNPEHRREPVVRRGSVVYRPAGPGSALMAELLTHLERVGFDQAPRFLGIDEAGRFMVDYIEGDTYQNPPWQEDDAANAEALGVLARLLRELHDTGTGFAPSPGLEPVRPLPLPGDTWSHGDAGYPNVVFRDGEPVALIDWEFVAPASPLVDPGGLLALATRGPKPGEHDNDRRGSAMHRAAEAIADGYGLVDLPTLYSAAAIVLDDAADYWEQLGLDDANIGAARWRSQWLRATDHDRPTT